jgi:serine/threonine-protein kinase
MTEHLPDAIGRYRVTGLLGRGAMGTVYRAHDPLIDRAVAVKVVLPELLEAEGGEDFRARFRREAQAAGRCAHPNIVAVHDFADDGPAPFIVMELVAGKTLHAALRARGALAQKAALGIALQVLDALDYAHAAGITHRDIKPANVVLLPDGRVKVMDFGVARLNRTSLTNDGVMIGTPSYMAPEQVLGAGVDQRADIFATGIMLYEMLVGQTPFAGATLTQLLYKQAHHDLSRGEEMDRVPPPVHEVLRRAVAQDPEARYASAGAFAADLRRLAGLPAPAAPAPADATVVVPKRDTPAAAGAGTFGTGAFGTGTLDPALLERAERELASHVGPMARVFVRRVAQAATSVDEFYRDLSVHIPREAERTRFLSSHGSVPGAGASRPGGRTDAAGIAPAAVDAAQAALASFVGPIAKVLAHRAAERARSLDDFHDMLAAELAGEDERTAFRRKLRTGR